MIFLSFDPLIGTVSRLATAVLILNNYYAFLHNRSVREAPFYNDREQGPQFYRKSDPKERRKHIRPKSWYGAQNTERKSKERPQSIHEISLDRDQQKNGINLGSEYSRVPYEQNDQKENTAGFRDRRHRHFESSRSLSSSYSSQVGSSADEGEDHHGVYSAYDMTGRSPYGSLVLRRYSQSSLSSSSASWQQSTNSLGHYAVKGQWGTGSLASSSADKFHGHTVHKAVFLKSPPKISEDTSAGNVTFISDTHTNQTSHHRIRVQAQPHRSQNHVYAQATPYCSDHHDTSSVPNPNRTYNQSVTNSSAGVTQVYQNVMQVTSVHSQSTRNPNINEHEGEQTSHSVKDLAKRFSGENQAFFSESIEEIYEMSDRDRRRVKAQTWPKFAYVHSPTEHTIRVDQVGGFEVAPPKPPYPQRIVEDLAVVETKVEARVTNVTSHEQWSNVNGSPNPDVLASHRLSLQELIKIHENKIAKHAQSAKATAHAQIYLKRPPSEVKARNAQSPQTSPRESQTDAGWGGSNQAAHKQAGAVSRAGENRAPVVTQYELTDLKSVDKAPIKVVEVTEKGCAASVNSDLHERPPVKPKRHRTIGVVGIRQQIDRVCEGKTERKPKRHTAIGIVNVKAEAMPARQVVKEETVVVSHACYSLAAEVDSLNKDQRDNVDMVSHRKEYADMVGDGNDDEVFERDQNSLPFVRSEGFVQPRLESEHDRERKPRNEEHSKTEGLTRITVASPERPVQAVESVSSQQSSSHFLKPDVRTWSVPVSTRTYNYPKPYSISKAVPVAQVSPVNPALDESSRAKLSKDDFTDTLPLSRSQSAREMYETRLALWNLYPPDNTPEIHSSDTSGNTPFQQNIITESERNRASSMKALESPEKTMTHEVDAKSEPRGHTRQNKEEYYLKFIEKLKNENKELITKYEAEKRELKQKYEEQRKVANAYQKLEDRYRRRVHELQEALSGCTCQSPFVCQNHVKISQNLSIR